MISSPLIKLKTIFWPSSCLLQEFYTPIEEAVQEITRRRNDDTLKQKVDNFLNGDTPEHFGTDLAFLYLSRFIATPNFEAFKCSEIAEKYHLPLIIGQDKKSKLVSDNELKLPLGKLPVVKGINRNGREIIEYFTIIDFSACQGKPLEQVRTLSGENLDSFHNNLFESQELKNVIIAEESNWVDRHFRDNIYKQYRHTMALMCYYGIQLESFTPEEYDFFAKNVYPAFKEIEKEIGVKPLIVEHISEKEERIRNWNSYPTKLYAMIKTQHERITKNNK